MRKYGFVAVGVIIGLLVVGGLYALPGLLGGVAAQYGNDDRRRSWTRLARSPWSARVRYRPSLIRLWP